MKLFILGGGGKGGATAPPDFKGAQRIILPQKYFLLRILAPPDLQ